MSIKEIKKCEEFCLRTNNEGIKFSILIGAPVLIEHNGILGIKEYAWEWPSELYPSNYRFLEEELVVLLRKCLRYFCSRYSYHINTFKVCLE